MTVFLWMILVGAIVGGMVFFISRDKTGESKTKPENNYKDISEPVSEMIRIIESGEGFTFRGRGPHGLYYGYYCLNFGEHTPEILISRCKLEEDYADAIWMTKDEVVALVSAFYQNLDKNILHAKQQERERWCKMLGVSQNTEEDK